MGITILKISFGEVYLGNHVLRFRLRVAVKLNFRPYIQRYTSPNENYEYSYALNDRNSKEATHLTKLNIEPFMSSVFFFGGGAVGVLLFFLSYGHNCRYFLFNMHIQYIQMYICLLRGTTTCMQFGRTQ